MITAAPPRLSAGVLTADLTPLGAELETLRGHAAWAHVDVMDGVFCPQPTVGPAFVAAVASARIPVDAHLMVTEPRRLLPDIAAAGAAVITVHTEATAHLPAWPVSLAPFIVAGWLVVGLIVVAIVYRGPRAANLALAGAAMGEVVSEPTTERLSVPEAVRPPDPVG